MALTGASIGSYTDSFVSFVIGYGSLFGIGSGVCYIVAL